MDNVTTSSIQNTSVNLDGLLEILGKNLYSSPNVALRELIQNASDACERHRIESGQPKDYFVRLTCRPGERQLVITDNGSGLTHDEIHEFLATIGSGYSRVLRNQTQSEDIIGYFGLGFLSAYVVADKVEVVTTSYKSPEESWKFASTGGKNYSISPASNGPVGTTVTLNLSDDFWTLADADFVGALVQKYCCLLDIPIFLNQDDQPLNSLSRPWDIDPYAPAIRQKKLASEFAQVFETSFEPIATCLIPADNPLGLKGLLWIQGGGSYASSDNRNISVFIRNMFITNEDKELLPRWAGFCGGVVESPRFLPTASRESLQRDEYYETVRLYLRDLLTEELRRLVVEEPATWRRIHNRHNQALLGAAISDDQLFETTCQSLKVPTTDGELTIPEILSRSENRICIKPGGETGHEEILFRARGMPLVKGFWYGAMAFCEKYAALKGINTQVLGSKSSQISVFPKVTPNSAELETLLTNLFQSEQHDVAFTAFTPEQIPLIAMQDDEVITRKRIDDDEADKRISSAALSLARLHTKSEPIEKDRTVFINLDNPLIQSLPGLPAQRQNEVRDLMVSLMEFLCLDSSQLDRGLDKVFEHFNSVMLTLLAEGGD